MLDNETSRFSGLTNLIQLLFYTIFPRAFTNSSHSRFIIRHAKFLQSQAFQTRLLTYAAKELLVILHQIQQCLQHIKMLLAVESNARREYCQSFALQGRWYQIGPWSVRGPYACNNKANHKHQQDVVDEATTLTISLINTVTQVYGNLTLLNASMRWLGLRLNAQLTEAVKPDAMDGSLDLQGEIPLESLTNLNFPSARIALTHIVPSLRSLDGHLKARIALQQDVEAA